MFRCSENEPRCTVEDILDFVEEILRNTSQESIAVVKSGDDKRGHEGLCCFSSEKSADRTNLSNLKIRTMTDFSYLLLHRERIVKDDA